MSEVDVGADAPDPDRTAIAVVAGIVDVLYVKGEEETPPCMEGVVAHDNIFTAVGKVAVAKEEAEAAVFQVILVVFFDGIAGEGGAEFVGAAMPARASIVAGDDDGLRIF